MKHVGELRRSIRQLGERLRETSAGVPIVTVDGLAASGKGTIATMLAQTLRWHYLDSGAYYRALAMAAMHGGVFLDDENELLSLIGRNPVVLCRQAPWMAPEFFINGECVSPIARSERVAVMASRMACLPKVRHQLNKKFINQCVSPGIIADGRDMGTVVFPKATMKIFITCDLEVRAKRRFDQMAEMGRPKSRADIMRDIGERDRRDSTRTIAPMRPAHDAIMLNSSELGLLETLNNLVQLTPMGCR